MIDASAAEPMYSETYPKASQNDAPTVMSLNNVVDQLDKSKRTMMSGSM